MKQIFFIILVLSLVCSCTQRDTVITGKLTANANRVIYSNPIEGTNFDGFRDTIYTDKDGRFELRLELKQPSFISLWTEDNDMSAKILIEKGKNYHIVMDAESDIEFAGDSNEGQQLYASLPNPSFISMQIGELQEESSLTTIHEKIQGMKSQDIAQFQELYDENKISDSFFNIIKIDRDCYYASLESRILQLKMYPIIIYGDEEGETLYDEAHVMEALENIYTQYPPSEGKYMVSSFWGEYTKYFIEDYSLLFSKKIDIETLRELHTKGGLHTAYINEAQKRLEGKALEFYQAAYIFGASIQKGFEKELTTLFNQFETDYPNSKYSKYLKPHIDAIVEYHAKVEAEAEADIKFVEQFENMNSLREVITTLRGKMIYVDVWATWCGPCKEQFESSDNLKKILKENDIEMLYISIDDDKNDNQWREMIKYYNLEGNHLRANQSLVNDLIALYDDSGRIAIPWYILINEDGEIINNHAKRPSDIRVYKDLVE